MLTVDQINNVTFSKARGGYSTVEVDDFIDKCADTVAGLIEERNTSNKKLEVLADKLVEYRNEEDSIRSALVNAQRLGDTIVRESNQKAALTLEDATIKADKIVAEAEKKAEEILNGITDQVKAQEAELVRLQHEVALFKDRMLVIYKEHLSLINVLPEEPVKEEVAEPVAEEPAIEETAAEEPVAVETPVEEPAIEEPAGETAPEQVEVVPLFSLEEVAAASEEPAEEVAKSRFSDLKFGDDYDIGEDKDDSASKGFFKRKK
ncbi:MAG: DivIVA domain-containing protein [Clostridia bacterium]|nr:DivIVA domain-containing protein [Clostridia bacterium]